MTQDRSRLTTLKPSISQQKDKSFSSRSSLGQIGELVALHYLQAETQVLEDKNWQGKSGELDLIMRKEQMLIVVEVRSTSSQWLDRPAEATPLSKQRQVARCTHEYIQQRPSYLPTIMDIRFDIIGLFIPPHLWAVDSLTKGAPLTTGVGFESKTGIKQVCFDHPDIIIDHVENAYFSPWAF